MARHTLCLPIVSRSCQPLGNLRKSSSSHRNSVSFRFDLWLYFLMGKHRGFCRQTTVNQIYGENNIEKRFALIQSWKREWSGFVSTINVVHFNLNYSMVYAVTFVRTYMSVLSSSSDGSNENAITLHLHPAIDAFTHQTRLDENDYYYWVHRTGRCSIDSNFLPVERTPLTHLTPAKAQNNWRWWLSGFHATVK